jgi:hypothetical protein
MVLIDLDDLQRRPATVPLEILLHQSQEDPKFMNLRRVHLNGFRWITSEHQMLLQKFIKTFREFVKAASIAAIDRKNRSGPDWIDIDAPLLQPGTVQTSENFGRMGERISEDPPDRFLREPPAAL